MSKKTAGIVALIAGIVILGLFLLTDRLGLGMAGFGPVQIAGTIVGAIVIALGLFLTLKKQPPRATPFNVGFVKTDQLGKYEKKFEVIG